MAFNPANCTENFTYQDGFQTTLSSAITASDTAIPLTLLPDGVEGTLVAEPGTDNEEEIYFTSKGTGVVNCPSASAGRGVNSTAIAHNSGVVVKMLVSKASMEALQYGGSIKNNSITKDKLFSSFLQGWIPAGETITCGTNDTLTASTDFVAILNIGDKIWFKDDGVAKWGYVFTKPSTTTFTIAMGIADTTYSQVASGSVITEPYYSKAENPTGMIPAIKYTTITATGWDNLQTATHYLAMYGGTADWQFSVGGTSTTNSILLVCPVKAKKDENIVGIRSKDNGTFTTNVGVCTTTAGTANINVYINQAGGAYEPTGYKSCEGHIRFIANY